MIFLNSVGALHAYIDVTIKTTDLNPNVDTASSNSW